MWRPQQRLVRDLTQQRRQDLRLAPARDARPFPLDSPEISTILRLGLSAYRRFARSEQPSIVGPKSGRAHPPCPLDQRQMGAPQFSIRRTSYETAALATRTYDVVRDVAAGDSPDQLDPSGSP